MGASRIILVRGAIGRVLAALSAATGLAAVWTFIANVLSKSFGAVVLLADVDD
jgi:hypothetical protein